MSAQKKTIAIPVKVGRSTRPKVRRRAIPVAPASSQPVTTQPTPPIPPHPLKQPIHQLPDHQKQRLMWGIVAVAMLIIVFGWALSLGNVLKQDNREVSLLQQISSLFRGFDVPSQPADNQSPEIRQLEDQVFPQF